MRKLASIQKITSIKPIENADSIEVARVLGWHVVVKKGEYKAGDKIVYVEIDSVLPARNEFEFLEKNKYRIRTIKLRGQVSQGICFPLSILPTGSYKLGDDVTDAIGITKYEPPIPACLDGKAKGMFPSFIPKTDEMRVQVLVDILKDFIGKRFMVTEKLDGTSATYYFNNNNFGVCSRNLELVEDSRNTLWQIEEKHNIEAKLREMERNIAIQGEVIGSGIQSNKYKLKENERRLYVFNIYDIDRAEYLNFEEFKDVLDKLELDAVPILDLDYKFINDVDALVELSKGNSVLNKQTRREGIVIKLHEEMNYMGGKVSFKVINPDFLIKYKE